MKLIFSILILSNLLNSVVVARDIIVIEHIHNIESALMTKKILMNKFKIPENFIHVYEQNISCSNKPTAIVQLCILEQGELEVRKIDNYVLKNAFGVFLDQTENSTAKE